MGIVDVKMKIGPDCCDTMSIPDELLGSIVVSINTMHDWANKIGFRGRYGDFAAVAMQYFAVGCEDWEIYVRNDNFDSIFMYCNSDQVEDVIERILYIYDEFGEIAYEILKDSFDAAGEMAVDVLDFAEKWIEADKNKNRGKEHEK